MVFLIILACRSFWHENCIKNRGDGTKSEAWIHGEKMGEITDKSKGKIKQAVGDLIGNKKLKREGERDELKGEVKGALKDVKRAIKRAGK